MTGQRPARTLAAGASLLLSLILGAACSLRLMAPKLTPDEEEFLSKVRYIITVLERRAFLRTSPTERLKFIEEFWSKRDADTTTAENEFREAYFDRLEEADRLFSGEGRPGWLTDRGRVFIILGPPEHRETYSGGYMDATGQILRDRIIWYYRGIPLLFIDTRGNGEFELAVNDLVRLESLQALLSELPENEGGEPRGKALLFDFSHALRKDPSGLRLLALEVPYKLIWFNARGESLETVLSLRLIITDAAGRTAARQAQDIPLSFTEKQLLRLKGKAYTFEIPLLLGEGTYQARVSLKNGGSGEELKKTFTFVIPKK